MVLGIALALSGCGEDRSKAGHEVSRGSPTFSGGQSPFDGLPQLEPGTLSGRLYYVAADDPECTLHVHDLTTGTDEALGSVGKTCGFLRNFTASSDGHHLAWRDEEGRIALLDLEMGSIRVLGGAGEVDQRLEAGATQGPVFSPDSARVAWCEGGDAPHLVIAETSGDAAPVRGPDGCRAALTAQGLAELRGGRIFVDGAPFEPAVPVEDPYQLVATRHGDRLAVVSHREVEGRLHGAVDVFELDGASVGSYTTRRDLGVDGMTLMFTIQTLSPTGRSALVYWGCIVQLAPFTEAARFPLLYGEEVRLGLIAYSPDARYAVMPWEPHPGIPSGGGEQPEPARGGIVIFDADTFEPLHRLPVRTRNVAWVP